MPTIVRKSELARAKQRYHEMQEPSLMERRRDRNRTEGAGRARNSKMPGPEQRKRLPPPEQLHLLWNSYFRLCERNDPARVDVLDSIVAHIAAFGPLEYDRSEFFRTGSL